VLVESSQPRRLEREWETLTVSSSVTSPADLVIRAKPREPSALVRYMSVPMGAQRYTTLLTSILRELLTIRRSAPSIWPQLY
jgi:hypothetical protein